MPPDNDEVKNLIDQLAQLALAPQMQNEALNMILLQAGALAQVSMIAQALQQELDPPPDPPETPEEKAKKEQESRMVEMMKQLQKASPPVEWPEPPETEDEESEEEQKPE